MGHSACKRFHVPALASLSASLATTMTIQGGGDPAHPHRFEAENENSELEPFAGTAGRRI